MKSKVSNNPNNNHGYEVKGTVYIILGAFLIFCFVSIALNIPLFDGIGSFILGMLGYFAFPIATYLFAAGIALSLGKRFMVNKSCVVFGILMVIFAGLILQLMTSAETVRGEFTTYVDYCYNFAKNNTMGGLLFGIVAYAFVSFLSVIGTYILCATGFVVCLSLIWSQLIRKHVSASDKGKTRVFKNEFVKGNSAPKPVTNVTDHSLFVDYIVPTKHDVKSESGSTSSMRISGMEHISSYPNVNSNFANSDEAASREKARQILYGNSEQTYKNYERNLFDRGNDKNVKQTVTSDVSIGAYPFVNRLSQLADRKEDNEQRKPLPSFEFPAKQISGSSFIPGEIVNGDYVRPPAILSDEGAILSDTGDICQVLERKEEPQRPIIVGDPYISDENNLNSNGQADTPSDDFMQSRPDIVVGDRVNDNSEDETEKHEEISQSDHIDYKTFKPEEITDNNGIIDGDRFSGSENKSDLKNEVYEERPQTALSMLEKFDRERRYNAENRNENFDEPSKIVGSLTQAEHSYDLPHDMSMMSGSEATDLIADCVNDVDDTCELPLASSASVSRKTDLAKVEASESPSFEDNSTANVKDIFAGATNRDSDLDNLTLTIDDNIVDMSGKIEETDIDNTGYYTKEENFGISPKFKQPQQISAHIPQSETKSEQKSDEVQVKKLRKKHRRYEAPPLDLLINNSTDPNEYGSDYEAKSRELENTLNDLKLPAKVQNITRGPAVTRYELEMPAGISIKRILGYESDISYALATTGKVRIEAPIPGQKAVGVEVPNETVAIVSLREVIGSKEFMSSSSPITLALGKDIAGKIITCPLEKMPHLLIAGTTGSGKSACLNSIIASVLYKSSPDEVKLILIDPKQLEFAVYAKMPHLLIGDIINDASQAINAFKWARGEMERRYTLMASCGNCRDINEFNNSEAVKSGEQEKLCRIVIIVDELAEILMDRIYQKELEGYIKSMAQKCRAAGMHLILATQRPSVDVINGTIKANFPSRIAFAVKSYNDSKTILDQAGAETLVGRGDMLYFPTSQTEPKRVQGSFVSTEEIVAVVDYVKTHNECDFDTEIINSIMKTDEVAATEMDATSAGADEGTQDALLKEVVRRMLILNQISATSIQTRFSIGYARAARIISQLEMNGYISEMDSSKHREIYITKEMFPSIFGEPFEKEE